MFKIKRIWHLLNAFEKIRIILITAEQLILTALDLVLLASLYLLISKLNSSEEFQRLGILNDFIKVLSLNGSENSSTPYFTLAFITVIKVLMSFSLQRKTMRFLGEAQQRISKEIVQDLSISKLTHIKGLTSQELSYLATTSVDAAILFTLSSFINLIVDGILIICVLSFLVVSSKFQVLWVLFFIAIVSYFLQRTLSKKAQIVGQRESASHLNSINLLDDTFSNLREIRLRGQLPTFLNLFGSERKINSLCTQDRNLLQLFPKYIFEIIMIIVLCGFAIVSINFQLTAAEVSSIFSFIIVISVRILPALIRIQSSITLIHSWAGVSEKLFNSNYSPIGSYKDEIIKPEVLISSGIKAPFPQYVMCIKFENVSFGYKKNTEEILSKANLTIQNKEFIACIGPSGSGKSTLADLLGGFLEPSTGRITINELSIDEFVTEFPGKLAYIPQEVRLIQGSILENISLKIGRFSDPELARIEKLMETVGLSSTRFADANGKYIRIGPSYSELSGGEKQRVGLARAMYSNPDIIIMDEMTSSLDTDSQKLITDVINSMKGKVTLLVIAHRLETIQGADRILTIQNGKILEIPNFSNR